MMGDDGFVVPAFTTASGIPPHGMGSPKHLVQFYEDDAVLLSSVAAFLDEGLRAGDAVLVVATDKHRTALAQRLADRGHDLNALRDAGRVSLLDAAVTLSKLMRGGQPDPVLFERSVGESVESTLRALPPGSRLRAYGEMVDLLWQSGARTGALRLEQLWNDLQRRHAFTLFCAYAMASFYKEPSDMERVSATHTHVVPNRPAAPPAPVPAETRPTVDAPAAGDHVDQLMREIGRRDQIEEALREALTDLRSNERALRQSEQQLHLVTDSLPVLVSFVDAEGRYQFVSAAYERWFGRSKTEIVGRHLRDVLGERAYAAIEGYVQRALTGERVAYQAQLPYKDGGNRFIEATYVPDVAADGSVSGFVALVADVTEKMSFEIFRAAAAARSEKLLKITAAIAEAVTPEQVYEALVDHVATAVGAKTAALWLVVEDGQNAVLARALGYPDEIRQKLKSLSLSDHAGLPAVESIRTGEPVWVGSRAELLGRFPAVEALVSPAQSYRVACLPILRGSAPVGTLALSIDDGGPAHEDERDFLLLVARYAGQAIERVRLLEAERRSRSSADAAAARAEQLYRFAAAVVAADRIETVYDAALTAIEAALGTKRAAILTYEGDEVMRFRAWRNLSGDYRAAVEGHSPWPRDATAPEPVLIANVERDPNLASYAALFRSEGIGALAFIPLVTRGRLLGKFMVYYDRPHEFASYEIETARAISNHLASVITRFNVVARLEDTIRYNEIFAGVLAHDLRNPLSAMINAAQMMLMRREGESPGTDREVRPLARILSSGQRMTLMIDQLLDFTRARSGGGIRLDPQETNLAELCEQATHELELAHPEWSISCHTSGDLWGTWDAPRLLQVLSNLLANAGQHGAPGSAISTRIDGSDAEQVTIEVHNLGTIPDVLLPHLFDPFRSTGHRRDRSRGLGLGLFIVREIVRAHGGTVTVATDESAGTTFTIRLPRHAARPAASPT